MQTHCAAGEQPCRGFTHLGLLVLLLTGLQMTDPWNSLCSRIHAEVKPINLEQGWCDACTQTINDKLALLGHKLTLEGAPALLGLTIPVYRCCVYTNLACVRQCHTRRIDAVEQVEF